MKNLVLRALGVAALLAPGAVFAQTTGTLVGHVFDQSGSPIRGVKVVATSRTQIGGARTTTTDSEGLFRFPGLTPGNFTVTLSAHRLKTIVQENVSVDAVSTKEIDLVMDVESAQEEVRIITKAPPINTTQATVGETFDQDFVNNLPVSSRSFQGVAALTPGVSDAGDGNPSIRGGARFNNSYTVDGFQTTDPVTSTFTENFTFAAMNQVQVRTASFGAEWSDSLGGGVNIITKSGSNRLEVDSTFTYSDQNMRLFKDARDIGTNRLMVAELAVGGPIIKDKLWFFGSAQGVSNIFTLPRDPVLGPHPSRNVVAFTGTFKLTYQLGPRNKIDFNTRYEPGNFHNTLQDPLAEAEAEEHRYQSVRFFGLEWHGILTDSLVLSMRAGINQNMINVEPQSCQWDPNCANVPGTFDVGTGIQRYNYTSQSRNLRQAVQLAGSIEYFKDTKRFGSHHLRIGARLQADRSESAETTPGDYIDRVLTTEMGTTPISREETCSTDPKSNNGVCNHNWLYSDMSAKKFIAFLAEAWQPTRYLTLRPELAFHMTSSRNDKSSLVTDTLAFTPHLSVAWDATHDGRTVVRASFNNYVDHGFLALAGFTSRALFQKRCDWDPQAQAYIRDCRSSGGDSGTTVGLPCGPDGVNPDGSRCDTKLRLPRVWEYTLGAEREIATGITLGADYVYRKFVHQWEDLETNGIWNKSGTGLDRTGMWKTGRAQFIFDLETPDEAQRVYHAVTVAARKREGRLKMLLAYTWTRYMGTDDSSIASLYLDNPGQSQFFYGPMSTDRRHDVRADLTYVLSNWASVGIIYEYRSGGPYSRRYYDPAFQSFSAFRTGRGYDTRGTLSPDDDTPLRLPDQNKLNVQARFSLQRFIKQQVDVWVDVQNILALRTTTGVFEQDGQFFGREITRLPPLTARVGMEYRFR